MSRSAQEYESHVRAQRLRSDGPACDDALPFEVLVFNEGAPTPHWRATERTRDKAERLAQRYRDRAAKNGWNVRVEVRP